MNQYITPAIVQEAKDMLADGRDYFPGFFNGKVSGETHGLPESLMLYNYGDSVCLVAHNDECEMSKATVLAVVASV